jgi:hypothetical protein
VSLLGLPFLLLLCTAGLALLVAVALMWSRWQRRWAFPGRALSLLLVMLFGAALGGTLLNRSFGFYPSMDDLLAISAQAYQPPPSFGVAKDQTRLVISTRNWRQQARRQAKAGHGLCSPSPSAAPAPASPEALADHHRGDHKPRQRPGHQPGHQPPPTRPRRLHTASRRLSVLSHRWGHHRLIPTTPITSEGA